MIRISQALTLAAGAALSFVVIEASPARADLVRYDFTVEILPVPDLFQPLLGTRGTGFFSYDDEAPPIFDAFGVEYVGVNEIEFNFLGTTYTASDDVGLAGGPSGIPYPSVALVDGVFTGLNYVVTSPSSAEAGFLFNASGGATPPFFAGRGAIATRDFISNPVSAAGLSSGGEGLSEGQVTYTLAQSVPEPSPIGGTLLVLGLSWWLKKKPKKLISGISGVTPLVDKA
jgi:hypothetical protein